ncbi:MAG: STAS domain-containing protein [Deltaproteobacteria bacterium]|nr:STAS domain-containing protein [Deltaproteobacteria bacterium]
MAAAITFKDEFTINQLDTLFNTIRDTINSSDEIVVNTENITKVDIAGVQMLVALKKECIRKGQEVTLKVSDAVADLMSMIGVREI